MITTVMQVCEEKLPKLQVCACPDVVLSCVWKRSASSFFNFTLVHRDQIHICGSCSGSPPARALAPILLRSGRRESQRGTGFNS